jgi:hypothetical protein
MDKLGIEGRLDLVAIAPAHRALPRNDHFVSTPDAVPLYGRWNIRHFTPVLNNTSFRYSTIFTGR